MGMSSAHELIGLRLEPNAEAGSRVFTFDKTVLLAESELPQPIDSGGYHRLCGERKIGTTGLSSAPTVAGRDGVSICRLRQVVIQAFQNRYRTFGNALRRARIARRQPPCGPRERNSAPA
jgi:hypothetical protein